jgi:hypothetical protein
MPHKKKTQEEFIKEMFAINPDIEILGIYFHSDIDIECCCNICHCKWFLTPHSLLKNKTATCPVCSGRKLVVGINDLWTTNPNMAKLLLNPEEGYEYTHGSVHKTNWMCPDCKTIFKDKIINNTVRSGLSCKNCSDGLSIPNKFISNILSYLNEDFKTEKIFEWSNNKQYDVYIPKFNCIIEMHGGQHYHNRKNSYISTEYQEENDKYKIDLAKQNNIDLYIVIDSRYSELEWIKNNIIASKLSELYDLSKIDWEYCFINAQKSIVIESVNLFNSGYIVSEIAHIVKLSTSTISIYLNRATKLGLCYYDGKVSRLEQKSKKIICLNTGEIFNSLKEATRWCNTGLSMHLSGKCQTGGKHPLTKEPLKWMYYNKYLTTINKII